MREVPKEIMADLVGRGGMSEREVRLAWSAATAIHEVTVSTLFGSISRAHTMLPNLGSVIAAMALKLMEAEVERDIKKLAEFCMEAPASMNEPPSDNLGTDKPNAPSTVAAFTDMLKASGIDFDLTKGAGS